MSLQRIILPPYESVLVGEHVSFIYVYIEEILGEIVSRLSNLQPDIWGPLSPIQYLKSRGPLNVTHPYYIA